METDYKKLVKEQKNELQELHSRMDTDAGLADLGSYTLQDVNKKNVPRAISVTLNDAKVFAWTVESSLGRASEQVIVETDDKKLDTAYIEDAVKASLAAASDRLTNRGDWPLNPFFDQQTCRRGRAAARCLFRIDKEIDKEGVLIPDIVYWDTRYMYYGMGNDGFAWAAYEMERSKGDIEVDYPDATVSGKAATVLDIWAPDHNEVYIDDKKIKEEPNPYGYVPVCFQMVPLGSMLADKGAIKYRGESIFFLIRDLLPELNRLVSLIQSLNQKELEHALQWASEGGQTATPPKYADADSPGTVLSVDKGGGLSPVPYGYLRQQAWLLHSMIETRIQRGSLSNFEYGTFTQPMSAVALITVGEGRDQVFLPRLGTRGLLNQQLAYMLIDQLIKTEQSKIEIGPRGHKRVFDIRKLQGEYSIEFTYFVTSPKIDAARFSMASAARGMIPDKAIRRDILQREDPDEDERLMGWEEAEQLSVLVKMRRRIADLLKIADRGDEDARIDAELMAAEMGVTLEQILSGQMAPPQPGQTKREQAGEGLLPMFDKGGGIGGESSSQRAANIKATPQEGE